MNFLKKSGASCRHRGALNGMFSLFTSAKAGRGGRTIVISTIMSCFGVMGLYHSPFLLSLELRLNSPRRILCIRSLGALIQ